MKTVTITLKRQNILDFVDASTYKRTDATLDQASDRAQNALSSDSEDRNDAYLIGEYCDRRDATLRARLKFCIINDEEVLEYTNDETVGDYVYKLKVDDSFTASDLRSIGKKMDEYIKRGAIFNWYLQAGLDPTDNDMSIQVLEDEIAYALRGQPWGHRPMQPFGPAMFNFYKKNF